jgi:LPXTG-site transpeptidase (sortase) family protein
VASIVLDPGETVTCTYVNTQRGSIGDFVWNDLNGDGVQDGGESGINGVTINLINDLNGNGIIDFFEPLLGIQTTAGGGAYDFTGLIAGDYIVDVTDTGGVLSTMVLTGGTDPFAVTGLTAGQDYNNADFGYQSVPEIIDPAVTKSGSPSTAVVGDTVVFTITVFNNGNTDALGVQLVDTVPNFLDILSVTISPDLGQPVSIVGNTVTIDMGTIAPIDIFTITLTTRVNNLGQPPGGMNNVTLTTSSPGDDISNNQDDAYLSIVTAVLPDTGFEPNVRTELPPQPKSLRYTDLYDLWVEIPKLKAEMSIVGVPRVENGWDVTWLWDNAGYLSNTAFPTWKGNTGLTGHVTLPSGLPGPFANLDDLIWGDKVIIHAWGNRYIYEVRDVRLVEPHDTSVLDHEEYDWLTLITCKEYNRQENTYQWRLAVQAVLMNVEDDLEALH